MWDFTSENHGSLEYYMILPAYMPLVFITWELTKATFSQSASHLGTTHAFFMDIANEGQGCANTFNTMPVKEAKHLSAALFLAERET